MSGAQWLGIAFVVLLVGGLLFPIARVILIFRKGDELVSGGSWGRQLFGPRRDR